MKNVLIETARFEEHDGQVAENPWFSYTYTFNRDGQVIEQANRNPDGSEWSTVNHYSDSGNLLSTKSFDPTGALNSEVKYIYDANDRLAAEHVTRDGRVITPTTYAYDDAGRKVKIQELDFFEKIQEFNLPVKIQEELDSSGEANMMIGIEGTSTFVSTAEARRVETSYDDRGEVVEVKSFNIDGALVSRVEITRDARGTALEETQYVGAVFPLGPCASDSCSTEEMAALTEEQKAEFAAEVARLFSPGTAMSKHTHMYDSEGRLIESKFTMMGMEVSRQIFAYDEVGNRSEEVSYSADGTLGGKTVFAREYDEHGNWTRELVSTVSNWEGEFGLSTPVHVTLRQITYW